MLSSLSEANCETFYLQNIFCSSRIVWASVPISKYISGYYAAGMRVIPCQTTVKNIKKIVRKLWPQKLKVFDILWREKKHFFLKFFTKLFMFWGFSNKILIVLFYNLFLLKSVITSVIGQKHLIFSYFLCF